MPIIYVHGVATRDPERPFAGVEKYLQRYVAPVIAPDPDNVSILHVYWGELGAAFAYGGISRPRSILLGQGSGATGDNALERALVARAVEARWPAGLAQRAEPASGLTSGRARSGTSASLRLKDLSRDDLSDLLVEFVATGDGDSARQVDWTLVADAVAHDDAMWAELASAPDLESECQVLQRRLSARASRSGLVGMGGGASWTTRVGDGLRETLDGPRACPAHWRAWSRASFARA